MVFGCSGDCSKALKILENVYLKWERLLLHLVGLNTLGKKYQHCAGEKPNWSDENGTNKTSLLFRPLLAGGSR
ncbi:hypothetical protein SSCH_560003 [Syntrophaceticus schinkii]|uniref:Uncharacterized protein n=1 Tax=Syntrophaceticus schinkii TaxID=499207 RepID=A0A0B7MHY2_9FIRM|nr:hypothetical protein SSCH_560003 [Syntrophaceticus schinkii]